MTKYNELRGGYEFYDTDNKALSYSFNDCILTSFLLADRSRTIINVIFNDPATIVFWGDGTKTVVKCQEGDIFDKEKGLALCIAKKYLGNKSNFNNEFKKWIPAEQDTLITEIIEELESRKDYGTEYAQAMEDVITILTAKFGIGDIE